VDFGHRVIHVDKDATKLEGLNCGEIPIYEPAAVGGNSYPTTEDQAV
jgi:UDP-glucose 6-dehydrogenase